MPMIKVMLGIGFAGAIHEDELEIDQDELDACETDQDRVDLMFSCWQDWSNNYIDGHYELIEE